MSRIPRELHEHIDTAFPANVCLVATVLPDGFAQVTPRGSTMVYDDEHLALWERGQGSTSASLADGAADGLQSAPQSFEAAKSLRRVGELQTPGSRRRTRVRPVDTMLITSAATNA